jgi:hypothetical protein
VEAGILLAGVYLYWRTARTHASPGRSGRVTPNLVAGVLLVSGIIVLALDAAGL